MAFPAPIVTSDAVTAYRTYINELVGNRGKSIIATEEARTNVAYGKLTTPDQVTGVVLPAGGLICVLYYAQWKETVNGAATAGIFLGSNEVHIPWSIDGGASSSVTPTSISQVSVGSFTADRYRPLSTAADGLRGNHLWDEAGVAGNTDSTGYAGDVTTGQIVGHGLLDTGNPRALYGGPCYIWAAAGTYDVSIQFKASSGTVTAKERRLWVWAISF